MMCGPWSTVQMELRQPLCYHILNSKISVLNSGPVQVDSIRHVRRKTWQQPLQRELVHHVHQLFLSSTYQNLEHGSSKGPSGGFRSTHEDRAASRSMFGSTVQPQSSRMAQKILEHLDRSVSLKELELALSRLDPPKSTASSIESRNKRQYVRISDGFLLGREMGTRESEHLPKVISGPSPSKSRPVSELFKVPKSQGLSGSGVVFKPNEGQNLLVNCIVFDKTDTLITGKPVVVNTRLLKNMALCNFYEEVVSAEIKGPGVLSVERDLWNRQSSFHCLTHHVIHVEIGSLGFDEQTMTFSTNHLFGRT